MFIFKENAIKNLSDYREDKNLFSSMIFDFY